MYPPPPPSIPRTGKSTSASQMVAIPIVPDSLISDVVADDLDWVFTPPVSVENGMFKGRSLRFALAVAQEPVLGRRKTEKDRRPLGPAPIIRFRAVECKRRKSSGEDSEEEVDPSTLEPSHLICAAELASPSTTNNKPVNSSSSREPISTVPSRRFNPKKQVSNGRQNKNRSHFVNGEEDGEDGDVSLLEDGERLEIMRPSPPFTTTPDPPPTPATFRDMISKERESNIRSVSGTPQEDDRMDIDSGQESEDVETPYVYKRKVEPQSNSQHQTLAPRTKSGGSNASPSIIGSKGVRNLYGNLHVAGVRVPAPEGGMGTWFLFTDLSVRQEGTYSLRFRCFDLTAIAPDLGVPAPCLVECQSQPFRVYSPRQVPPLPKPTELAEHFAKQGFKLNTRKNERTVSSPPPPNSSTETIKESHRPGVKPVQHDDGAGIGGSSSSSTATAYDLSGENVTTSTDTGGGSNELLPTINSNNRKPS
ncbi:uncharacterized protein IL334_000617 [Kwoniella shivajii]|uniref:Velvet domain-containing protein n=1 Tax=Kwoniella shivajii TaxID=564305 RepID=A0ABZ1CR45_9TREE|nr:hypothetical protein IL334_000617 [Kwoniella shivajii]